MKVLSVILGALAGAVISGCMMKSASHTSSTSTTDARFVQMRSTLSVRCGQCHSKYVESSITPKSLLEEVTPGHPEKSVLLLSLRGASQYLAGAKDGTMPPGGDALPQSFFDKASSWITEQGAQPTPTPDPAAPTATPTPTGSTNGNCNGPYVKALLKGRCETCHSSWFATNVNPATDWFGFGIVDGGTDLAKDTVYCRLNGADTACANGGQKNMPTAGTLTKTELDTVKCFVQTLTTNSGGEAAKRLQDVVTIIDNKCASCHNTAINISTGPYAGNSLPGFGTCASDSCFTGAGLVIRGNLNSSWLYQSINGGMNGTDKMPPTNSPQLSNAEKTTIQNWITLMP